MRKTRFDALYSGIEEMNGYTVFYTDKGVYSVIMEISNSVEQYSADIDAYYSYTEFIASIIKILGEGYAIQKQDIFSQQEFKKDIAENEEYLSKAYFKYFEGRKYTDLKTYLIITQEKKSGRFFTFDKKKWREFHQKIDKVKDLFHSRKSMCRFLSAEEVQNYLYRYLSLEFKKERFGLDNIKVVDTSMALGKRNVRCMSVVDVDEVNLPTEIRPFIDEGIPKDLMSFLAEVPQTDCVIYNQVILIPSQRAELARLSKKRNRHASLPDPSNELAVADIEAVQNEIVKGGKLLVYSHFNIIVASDSNIDQGCNFIENSLDRQGITVSKSAFNQLELYANSFPGHSYDLSVEYDRFLTLHDAALCLFYKESRVGDEDTPLQIYLTNRQGIPIAMDISGKEGKNVLTTNSNFISIGPSGSGKSFNMNSIVRQLLKFLTDVVMVDTGNSYEGLCKFFKGRYISYTDEKPITMNPFKITRKEYNIEKIDFLKSLIFLLWKRSDGVVSQVEDRFISILISEYYASYFGRTGLSDSEVEERLQTLYASVREQEIENGLSIEAAEKIAYSKMEEEREIMKNTNFKVESLSFNTFYEFSCQRIPTLSKEKGVEIDFNQYKFLLEAFYKGGEFEKTLNDDFDSSLFDERFIVFEVDAIKDNKVLFPIVTLIIMDVFIQKMRLKKNRKALIIEEAWKALATPVMAEQIKYLYKTVRKFWGIVGVVTQEVGDIIGNPIVKDAIVNNSEITILLDQAKFKDRYDEIASLLGLSEVECRKIWTINNLDNKENRSFFREVYIRRGQKGSVYGVEEPPHCYITYTTERKEKDAFKEYIEKYGDIEIATDQFCADWKASGYKSAMQFVTNRQLPS